MFSQSGAVATAILDWARSINVGFAKFVSLGNMADLNEVDFLEYLGRDPETKLIVGYLEGISDGRRLVMAARQVTPEKPVILMKVGATVAGARAARSHTGALASSEAVVDAAFRQAGIVRATTMAEFFDHVLCFSYAPLPRGPGVAIVTNAGGPGVMAADALEGFGLEAAQLSPATLDALADALPTAAATANPIDVLGDAGADRYQTALELVRDDPGVDAVIALLTPQRVTEPERVARVISYLAREQSKPLLAVFMGGDAVSHAREMLDQARVPVYAYPERAVRTLAALVRYARYRQEALSEA
jgi:acetyltransferase